MKKQYILLIIMLCSSLYLAACIESENNTINKQLDANTEAVYDEIGLSKYDSLVEISFVREVSSGLKSLISNFPGETLDDNRWTRLYEEILGIKINYDWTASGDIYHQKLDFSINSKEIPDVMLVNKEQLQSLYNRDLIQDLTEVFDEYATPFTQETLTQEGSATIETATIDGKLMAIPSTSSFIESAEYVWIRTDWLENVGLTPPTSMEELLEISQAFVEKDPDQDSMKNTYGLALSNYLWDPVAGVNSFFAGFNAYPLLWIENEEGRLEYGGIQPEIKAALQTLQDMYRMNEIHEDFYIQKGENIKELIKKDKIGIVYGEQWSSFFLQEGRSKAVWKAYPIVTLQNKELKVPLRFNAFQFFVVSKDFEHPEAILKLFNLYLEKNWGETAEYEKYYSTPYPAWQMSPVTPYPPKKNYEAYLQIKEGRQTGDFSQLSPEAETIEQLIRSYEEGGINRFAGLGWYLTYGETGALSVFEQYDKYNQLLYDKFTGPPTSTMVEREEFLKQYQHETYMNIILGASIDEFDTFVEKWKELGGTQITTEVNEWYLNNK